MRKYKQFAIFWIGISASFSCTAIGQTNTFPASGSVGIGTLSPSGELSLGSLSSDIGDHINTAFNNGIYAVEIGVYDSSPAESAITLRSNSSWTPKIMIPTEGNVYFNNTGDFGIGTSTPSYRLDVAGNSHFSGGNVITYWDDGSGTGNLQKQAGGFVMSVDGSRDLEFATDGTVRLAIDGAGHVGIGVTSPNAALTVDSGTAGNYGVGTPDLSIAGNSSYNSTGVQFYRSAATGGYVGVDSYLAGVGGTPLVLNAVSGGNVGIGTTSPIYPLSVNGTIEAKEILVQTHGCPVKG